MYIVFEVFYKRNKIDGDQVYLGTEFYRGSPAR